MLARTQAEFARISISTWLLTLAALAPYALGWLAGAAVRLALWVVAAAIAGYRAGRGTEDSQ